MRDTQLAAYVQLLRAGGMIACATETLFGLLADARSEAAIERVVRTKHRGTAPIALLAPSLAYVDTIAVLSPTALALAERHWPGPLTLIVHAKPGLPAALLREGTVGVRVPGPSPALALVRAFGAALTATSCNPSGQPAARTSDEARAYFGEELAAIIEGVAPGGLASTLVDASSDALQVLRHGPVQL